VLAMSHVMLESLKGKQEISPQALYHFSGAYRGIREGLQHFGGSPSDTIIAAALSMAIHEDLNGQLDRGTLHLDAVQRMIELRGGIDQLEHNPILLHKICRCVTQR